MTTSFICVTINVEIVIELRSIVALKAKKKCRERKNLIGPKLEVLELVSIIASTSSPGRFSLALGGSALGTRLYSSVVGIKEVTKVKYYNPKEKKKSPVLYCP